MERVARELRQPIYAWWAQIARAMWSMMRGDADAERQVMAAFEIGTAGGQPDAATALGAQLFVVREHQGRLAELTDAMQARADAMPHIGWRAGFAYVLCEADRFEEARREMAALAAQGFAIPLNYAWISWMATLAEACMQLDDDAAAAVLYERLSPIGDQVAVTANVVICVSSIHYWCGLLATCLRRWDDAERHFAAAIAVNERLGIRPWVVRSRRGWAEMLVNRNAPGDAARARDIIAAGRTEAEQLGMGRELVRFDRLTQRLGSA